jgi:hypothetical protein
MRKRFTTLVTAVGLTLAGVAVGPTARADVPCTIANFSPRSAVVGLTPIVKTFSVDTSDCPVDSWTVSTSGYDFFVYPGGPQETFNPYSNSEAGAKDVIVTAVSYTDGYTETQKVFPNGFHLLRNTTWQRRTFNAGPEPVKKGARLSIKGRLLVADWTNHKYVPYARRTIAVQFRTGTGRYTTVGYAKTDTAGWVRTTVPAKATGYWRVSYGGDRVASPSVSIGDGVKVRR